MGKPLEDLSTQTLIPAIEASMDAYVLQLGRLPQAEVHEEPELLQVLTAVPHAFLNLASRARFPEARTDAAIDAALQRCRSRNVPFTWFVGPSTQPADLGQRLSAHGFNHVLDLTGMAVDLQNLNEARAEPAGLRVEPVVDADGLRAWSRVIPIGFGFPDLDHTTFFDLFSALGHGGETPWRLYLGRLEGEAVAASALLMVEGVALIPYVATLPEASRKGVGTAVTLAALREGRSMGYRVGTLYASPMGCSIYRQIGFQAHFPVGLYVWSSE